MINFLTPTEKDLTRIIEALRVEMIQTGLNEGLQSEHTIKISQKLDWFINLYLNQITHKR